jgi:hypothetical protein
MPWFYYSGNVPRTIPVKKGLSVAVIPHSKVEIIDPNLREVQALRKKGVLRRTGRPVGVKSVQSIPTVSGDEVKAVTPRSAMAQKIAEKGVTKDRGQAPKRPKGQPEMTEGELKVKEKERVEAEKAVEVPSENSTNSDSADVPMSDSFKEVEETDEIPSGADLVEVLSNVDRSPDEDTEGDEHKTSRRKRRKK